MRKILACAVLALALAGQAAHAQTAPRFVQFAPAATKGALYTPDNGPVSHTDREVINKTVCEQNADVLASA